MEFQSAGYERLKEALRGAAKDMGLNVNENQVGYVNFPFGKSPQPRKKSKFSKLDVEVCVKLELGALI